MKLDLESILEMWKEDCEIEEFKLDESSRKHLHCMQSI